MSEYLLLLGIIALSYVGHNMSVFYATVILALLKAVLPVSALHYIGSKGINWGIIILTVAMLVPVATGETGVKEIIGVFKSPEGFLAILVGVLVAICGGLGVNFIKTDPQVVVSLMLGTILGVFFFKGIPIGPLIAGGVVYSLLKLINYVLALWH